MGGVDGLQRYGMGLGFADIWTEGFANSDDEAKFDDKGVVCRARGAPVKIVFFPKCWDV